MRNKKRIIVYGVIALVVAAIIVSVSILVQKNKGKEKGNGVQNNDVYTADYIDAEEYFKTNSKSVVSSDAQKSAEMLSEAEATTILHERGFVQFAITTEYSDTGDYYFDREISPDSPERHPVYQTYYCTPNDELWTIVITNNQVTAYPISYLLSNEINVDVVVSQEITITSYDNVSQRFFVSEPNNDVVRVIVVETINATVIDGISADDLSGEES